MSVRSLEKVTVRVGFGFGVITRDAEGVRVQVIVISFEIIVELVPDSVRFVEVTFSLSVTSLRLSEWLCEAERESVMV